MAELSPPIERFILHWGEMGSRWGINRTVAQVHALLYVSEEPITAEDIANTLSIARSTVSTSLRELQSWDLIRVTHVLGDRRDHYEAVGDVWEMACIVADGRKRREFDPTLEVVRECVRALDGADRNAFARARLGEMEEFLESSTAFYESVRRLPPRAMKELFRRGSSIAAMLGTPSE